MKNQVGHGGKRKNSGRKAGTPNRVTQQVRESLSALYSDSFSDIEQSLQALKADPVQYLAAWSKFMPYFSPRLSTLQVIDAPEWVEFLTLSNEEKQARIAEIKRQIGNE